MPDFSIIYGENLSTNRYIRRRDHFDIRHGRLSAWVLAEQIHTL